MWVVTHHQYRISALVSQMSFCQETSVGFAKCWSFLSGYHPNQLVLTVHSCSFFCGIYPFNFLFLIILLQTFAFVDFGCYNVLDFQELVQIFKPINSVGTHASPIRSIRVKVHALMLL